MTVYIIKVIVFHNMHRLNKNRSTNMRHRPERTSNHIANITI